MGTYYTVIAVFRLKNTLELFDIETGKTYYYKPLVALTGDELHKLVELVDGKLVFLNSSKERN